MIRNIKLLKEELKQRRLIMLLVLTIYGLIGFLFPLVFVIIPIVMLMMLFPLSIEYGIKDGIKGVIHYFMLVFVDHIVNNLRRMKAIKEELSK